MNVAPHGECVDYIKAEMVFVTSVDERETAEAKSAAFEEMMQHARDCEECGDRFIELLADRKRKHDLVALDAAREQALAQAAVEAPLPLASEADDVVIFGPRTSVTEEVESLMRELGFHFGAAPLPKPLLVHGAVRPDYEFPATLSPYVGPMVSRIEADLTTYSIAANPDYDISGEFRAGLYYYSLGRWRYARMARDADMFRARLTGRIALPDDPALHPYPVWDKAR